jgi:hypothetical protein
MTDLFQGPEGARPYRLEPAPGGACDVVHVASERRCRAESETVACLVVDCLETGEYARAQRLLHSPVSLVLRNRDPKAVGTDPFGAEP